MIIHSNKWGQNTPNADFDYNEGVEFASGDSSAAILVDASEIRKLLKALREQAGLTQTQLGVLVYPDSKPNTAKIIVNQIESGERKLGLSTLSQIVEKLGLTLSLGISGFEKFPNSLAQ